MRRILAVVIGAAIAVALSPSMAQAAPAEASKSDRQVLVVEAFAKQPKARASFTHRNALMQDPPLGGCDYGDISGQVTGYYVNGVLSGTESDWSSKVLCTTTAPGQSMGGIIVESAEWLNGSNVAAGNIFTCSNCILGNSVGANIGGPSASGTYWWSGLVTLVLPAGWIWSSTPPSCLLLADDMLQCSVTTDTAYLPPIYP
ncbi:hypothetical protein [Polymorphospora sp. NPDC050346]|uniref:hypothetical protein n=1 Tax=Polymorphospora sp. NPDC050346 TaxID=3155780 RepID=UPI0033DAC577